ncbi:MAG: hypothetical protein ABI822_20820 [Bryobacteraceae bacterium]
MNQFKLDATQLDNWDFMSQLPVKIPSGRGNRALGSTETSALKAALRVGSAFGISPLIAAAEEVVSLSTPPKPGASILKPVKSLVSSTVAIKFSSSSELTGALAVASSLAAVGTVIGSFGLYASTIREVGFFSSVGGGITFNTPGAAAGGEITFILGTPSDFAGPYFGIAVSAGTGVSVGVTLLFSPVVGGTPALVLTLMGLAVNVSAVTPTKLPLNVTIEVTNTRITGVKF